MKRNWSAEQQARHWYTEGYDVGDKYRIWKPPIDRSTPLPRFDFRIMASTFDRNTFLEGFRVAYYKEVGRENYRT